MKIQPDVIHAQSISGYGPGWVGVGAEKVHASIVLSSQGDRFPWECRRFEDLSEVHFLRLVELRAELVIFGSGRRLRFPRPEWIKPLIDQQTGVETMDTEAACRTYNILAGEGRHVALALLVESEPL